MLYRLDDNRLPTLTQLPSLQAFGIDAVMLTPEAMQPIAPLAAQTPTPSTEDNAPATAMEMPLSLDDLFFECSRLHIRVLVPLDLAAPDATPESALALAKSWLYRGAAGFVVSGIDKLTPHATAAPDASPLSPPSPVRLRRQRSAPLHLANAEPEPQILTALHKLVAQFPGGRIMIGAANATATPMASLQLQIAVLAAAPAIDTSKLAALSAQSAPRALLSLASTASITPMDAAELLATNQPAILDSAALPPDVLARVFPPLAKGVVPDAPVTAAPPPPPPPPANVYGEFKPYIRKDQNTAAERKKKLEADKAAQDAADIANSTFPVQPMYEPILATPEGYVAFYHRLVQLHRANATLHEGAVHVLNTATPQVLAWVVTRSGSAPIVVACNLSAAPLKISLLEGLQKVGQDRDIARTLLHTAASSGVLNVSMMTVPAGAVYVGELQR